MDGGLTPTKDAVETKSNTLSEFGDDALLLTPLVCDRRLTVAASLLEAFCGICDGMECFNLKNKVIHSEINGVFSDRLSQQ